MSKNYNIKFNSKEPSKEDIEKFRDFDALLAQYQATPPAVGGRVRQLFYYGTAAAAAVALAIVYFFALAPSTSNSVTAEEYFAQQEFINPPFQQIEQVAHSHSLSVNQGGVFEYESGSRLVVPAAAFMNDRGQLVEGEVDIHFKEYKDYVDFFLSGIPMNFDSAAQQFALESAGMVEIFATQNGQRLSLAPDKSIEVELVAEVILPNINVQPDYRVYLLQEEARNWIYAGIDHMQLLEDEILDEKDPLYPMKKELMSQLALIEKEANAELEKIEATVPMPVKPVKPQLARGDYPTIELDFSDESLVVEGNSNQKYEGTIWQISPKNKDIDTRAFNITWESMRLKPINGQDYKLSLINGSNELDLIINPVLTGQEYEEALQTYQIELTAYENALAERDQQLAAQKAALSQQLEEDKATAQKDFDNRLLALQDQGLQYATTHGMIKRRVVNKFTAHQLGVWNCAQPILATNKAVKAEFIDQQGNRYDNHTAFLVDKAHNTIYRYYASQGTAVQFNEQSENLLWIIADQQKIAVFRPQEFKTLHNAKKNKYSFEMLLIDEEIDSEEDLRQVLAF